MTAILKSPVRVYPDRMAVYFFDGDVCADIVSGTKEQQKAVLALVGQAQRMARLMLDAVEEGGTSAATLDAMTRVLRDAGVMS
jgi:hypothetical protein